jgi:hypothetical protein
MKSKYISINQLRKILSKHYGKSIDDLTEHMEDDYSAWSGQAWDDGPLPEKMVGLTITFRKENEPS